MDLRPVDWTVVDACKLHKGEPVGRPLETAKTPIAIPFDDPAAVVTLISIAFTVGTGITAGAQNPEFAPEPPMAMGVPPDAGPQTQVDPPAVGVLPPLYCGIFSVPPERVAAPLDPVVVKVNAVSGLAAPPATRTLPDISSFSPWKYTPEEFNHLGPSSVESHHGPATVPDDGELPGPACVVQFPNPEITVLLTGCQ